MEFPPPAASALVFRAFFPSYSHSPSPLHLSLPFLATVEGNTVGTFNMLALARRGKARLLMASTSAIYYE